MKRNLRAAFVVFLSLLTLAACGGGGGGGGTTPDTTPPTVSPTSPLNNATNVAINADITATFSESMMAGSITPATFTLSDGINGVAGAVSYSGTTATFNPAADLAYATTYIATIITGVTDAAGNPLAASYTWSFKTRAGHNDTGITAAQCYTTGSDVLVTCNDAGATALNNAQDGMTGRDTNAANNDNADGRLGFSFAKVCNSGELAGSGACPANPTLGVTANTWGCTYDKITGLMWEVKTTGGVDDLRDQNKTYTNLDSTTADQQGDGTPPRVGEIYAATNSVGFMDAVNASGLCGHNDWRLPSTDELHSIVDYGILDLSIDAIWFPNTSSDSYWSASPYVANPANAWFVGFAHGGIGGSAATGTRTNSHYVRLVRGEAMPPKSYAISADGQEVTDQATGLVWRRCVEGMNWDAGAANCTGAAATYAHEGALVHATNQAGAALWRLPSVKELASIVDRSIAGPAIDPAAFPATPADYFWSVSPFRRYPDNAWVVRFGDGVVIFDPRIHSHYVRLVRAGQ